MNKLNWLFLLCGLLVKGSQAAENLGEQKPFLHPLFSDGMVVQQNQPLNVWGWTDIGAVVLVEFAQQSKKTKADNTGRWQVKLQPVTTGKSYTLRVRGKQNVVVKDIQAGEVWLCSGQSNMFWPIHLSANSGKAMAEAKDSNIRLFNVDRHMAVSELDTFQSYLPWHKATAKSVKNFSAVCYHFGKQLQQHLKVPVGLIHSSWGGTKIEAWTSRETLMKQGDYHRTFATLDEYSVDPEAAKLSLAIKQKQWWVENDPGSKVKALWSNSDFNDSDWAQAAVPGMWEKSVLPQYDGIVWYRKTIYLDEKSAKAFTHLSLGKIDDNDVTWVNGVQVGTTQNWDLPRNYSLPKKLLKAGENTIAVRVFDKAGGGGFHSLPEELKLFNNDTGLSLPLAGKWRFNAARKLTEMSAKIIDPINQNAPSLLFNAMIAPIAPFTMQGVIWYQGESNSKWPDVYQGQLRDMIANWRAYFTTPLGFHIVQLANYIPNKPARDKLAWPKIRDAQRLVAIEDPNAGLAVTIDIGDPHNIHPTNKLDVGKRLAKSALNITYGLEIVPAGPEPKTVTQYGNRIVVEYHNSATGLSLSKGRSLTGFEVCIEPNICENSQGIIEDNKVLIRLSQSATISHLRYAWSENPAVNLINAEGLPAVPFSSAVEQSPE